MQKYDGFVREFEEWTDKPRIRAEQKQAVDPLTSLYLLGGPGSRSVSGPQLRDAMASVRTDSERRRIIATCVPDFIHEVETGAIGAYLPTLAGMLASSLGSVVAEVLAWFFDARSTIRQDFVRGERSYSPKRLLSIIGIEPESFGESSKPSFVARVIAGAFGVRIADGTAWQFDIPDNIEALSEIATFRQFLDRCVTKTVRPELFENSDANRRSLRQILIKQAIEGSAYAKSQREHRGAGSRSFVGRWAWRQGRPIGDGGQGSVFIAERIVDPIITELRLRDLKYHVATTLGRILRDDDSVPRLVEQCAAPLTELFVRDVTLNGPTQYALKVFGSTDEKRREDLPARFQREVNALRFKRPGCVNIVDSGCEADNTYWAVYPFFQYGNLRAYLGAFKGDMWVALLAARSMLRGLIELHSDGLVHRDLKPENVFVDDSGELVIGDFGLVRSVDTDTSVTSLGESIGNDGYTPKWNRFDANASSDPRWDVYSMGKLMHHLVHGDVKPMFGDTHRIGPYDIQKVVQGSLAAAVNEILDGCIQPEMQSVRYATALELDAALQRIMEKYAVASVGTGVH